MFWVEGLGVLWIYSMRFKSKSSVNGIMDSFNPKRAQWAQIFIYTLH